MKERRKAKRIDLMIDIEVNISGEQEKYIFKTKDISQLGMCLITDRPIEINTVITTSFILPDTKDIIVIEGEIIWIREKPGVKKIYHMGIRFTSIIGKYKEMIEKYINNITFKVNKNNF